MRPIDRGAGGDHAGGNHGFPEGRSGGEDAGVILKKRADSLLLLGAERACEAEGKRRRDRGAGGALIADGNFDAQGGEKRDRVLEAPARQGDVADVVLRARDNPRLAERREAQGLGLVELGVLERGEPDEARLEGGGEVLLLDVDHVGEDERNLRRERTAEGAVDVTGAAGGKRTPGLDLVFSVVGRGQPNADDIAFARGFIDEALDCGAGYALEGREIGPLIGDDRAVLVDEEAVAGGGGVVLKREGDEIAESPVGHGVLVGKEPVIRIEADLGARVEGLGEKEAAKAASHGGRDRLGEKDPGMGALAGAGALEGYGDAEAVAGVAECGDIGGPVRLVEICGQEPACLVGEEWIDAHDEIVFGGERRSGGMGGGWGHGVGRYGASDLTGSVMSIYAARRLGSEEVSEDGAISDGYKLPGGAGCALDLRATAKTPNPVVFADGLVAGLPGLRAYPAQRIKVFAPPEKEAEEGDLIREWRRRYHGTSGDRSVIRRKQGWRRHKWLGCILRDSRRSRLSVPP